MLLAGLSSLAGALIGWLWAGPAAFPLMAPLAGAGLLLTGWAARQLSRSVPRTTYRRERWHRHDTIACIAAGIALIAVAALRLLEPAALVYYPFPTISVPAFDLRVGAAIMLLAVPALPLRAPLPRRARRLVADRRAARRTAAQQGAFAD